MSPPTQAMTKPGNGDDTSKAVEFIPYGAQDKVKLSIAMVKNLIAVKTKSGKTCSDTDAIKFVALCQARRLNPFEGDCFLIGYDGKDGPQFSLITAHQAFLKRAELNPEYDGMKSGIIVRNEDGSMNDLEGDFFLEGQQVLGGWATVYFKNRKQPMHKRIRLERFKKNYGIWMDDPAGMICKCAEADALRSSFPTMLGGLYLKEEIEPNREPKLSTPIFTPKTPQALPAGIQTPEPPSNAAPDPKAEQGDPAKEQAKAVRDLCKRDGVAEKDLIEFANAIGLCDDGITTLEGVFERNDTAAGMITENWDEFSRKIKETVN